MECAPASEANASEVHAMRLVDGTKERSEVISFAPADSEQCSDDTAARSSRRSSTHAPLFIDATEMKRKMRMNMVKPEYDVCDFYKQEGICQLVARSSLFEKTTLSVIAFNALWMAIDTDMNTAPMLLTADPIFQLMEHGFCIYFTWEWAMRFGAFRRKRDGIKDAWFVFDTFMVFIMVGETWVMTTVLLAMDATDGFGGGSSGTVRLLRLLRLSRMARMAKLLRSMPELLILIKGMASAMRSVMVTMLLLFLLIYVFSIAFRQLTTDTCIGQKKFGTMWVTIHTLWIDGTLLDSPGEVARALLNEEGQVHMLLFYIFVLLSALTVMNMLIGVLCEVVSAVAATEKEQITVATVKDGFMDIIKSGGLDTDGDHMISRYEFCELLHNADAVRLLEKVDVDPYAFVDVADFIFESEDGEDVQMSFSDFMETVLSLRGTNNATVKDIVDLRKFIQGRFASMETRLLGKRLTEYKTEQKQACLDTFKEGCSTEATSEPLPALPAPGPVRPVAQPCLGPTPHQNWWTEAAEMEGVLAATNRRLERFIRNMPAPGDVGQTGADDACLSGVLPGKPRLNGHGPVDSGATSQRSGSVVSISTLPPVQAVGLLPNESMQPQLLLDRLAELRAQLQQLGRAMATGVEELRGIQEVL